MADENMFYTDNAQQTNTNVNNNANIGEFYAGGDDGGASNGREYAPPQLYTTPDTPVPSGTYMPPSMNTFVPQSTEQLVFDTKSPSSSQTYDPSGQAYLPEKDVYDYGGGDGRLLGDPSGDASGRFAKDTGFRDVFWAVLFAVHLVALIGLMLGGLILGFTGDTPVDGDGETGEPEPETEGDEISRSESIRLFAICVVAAVAAGLFSTLWVYLIRRFAGTLIYISLGVSLLAYIVLGTFMFIIGNIIGGVIFLCLLVVLILIFVFARSRIQFAALTMKCVCEVIQMHPETIWVAVGSLVPLAIYLLLWSVTLLVVTNYSAGTWPIVVYAIFSVFWTSQVIKNVVHVTTSGVVATWFFVSPENMPKAPTRGALVRACTTSFGSIALGSLLVALIKTLRALIPRRGGLLGVILQVVLRFFDWVMRYFNRYAFTQVAIYGKTYIQAAKSTFELFQSRGVDAIVNDDFTGMVLNTGCLLGAALTAAVSGLLALFFVSSHLLPAIVFGLVIGFTMVMIVLEVIDSGVATLFVCLAEHPDILRERNPTLYAQFAERYGTKCSIFSDPTMQTNAKRPLPHTHTQKTHSHMHPHTNPPTSTPTPTLDSCLHPPSCCSYTRTPSDTHSH
eukprot:TRINITY_DN3310_c2_g1_i1.p1 TRINITY_DN3310_c2_g1~~TRINITY_DN3310_c2_g1_i1.p1  ORF type:complete len:620 (+),score=97.81 TRINITY_DN3310_c2_g1_i1:93-1952(+)